MPRELEDYRDNLELLGRLYPGKATLTVEETAQIIGCHKQTIVENTSLGWAPRNIRNIDIWNLRGNSVPMDKLAPKLIRRAAKKNYIAIVIDPIYKVITGDENSADQMAAFCNQFDKVCTELGCAVIYCHHHSKGSQGGKKSMDRASGSGVFARDPDALLDLIELEIPPSVIAQEQNNAKCRMCSKYLKKALPDYSEIVSPDDECSAKEMLELAQRWLTRDVFTALRQEIETSNKELASRSAWRIEGTLREFPKFKPVNLWFSYPRHITDNSGVLADLNSDDGFTSKGSPYKKNFSGRKSNKERKDDRKTALDKAFEACEDGGKAIISELSDYLGKSEKTIRRSLKESGEYWIDGGTAGKKGTDKID